MATSFTRRMNWTPLGEVFSDYPLDSVGVTEFQLQHDLFIRQDLELRDAPGGGGTLLVEDTDYTLGDEDSAISDLVSAAVGSGRNAMRSIIVINAAYQACALYASGKYVLDSFDKEDGEEIVTLSDEDYTIPDNTHDVVIDLTTVATEREITFGALARNLGRKITVQMNNASIAGYEAKFIPPSGEHFLYAGAEYDNLYVGLPGQRVTLQVREDGIYIMGGVVQPVALEPDIGGGWHLHNFDIWHFVAVGTSWTEVTTIAAELPDGTRKIKIFGSFTATATTELSFSEANAGTERDRCVTSASAWSTLKSNVPLSATKSFWIKASQAAGVSLDGNMGEYQLGPA